MYKRQNISFDLLNNDRSLDDVYIDLDVYINPVRNNLGSKDKTPKGRLLDKIYESNQHIVVLGQPGAGKTTSMKKIFKSLVEGKDKFVNQSKLPILIRLRDFDSKHENIEFPIREKILSFFNFQLYVKDFDGALVELVLKDNFSLFLEEINALIILDGFDEIPNQYLKNAVLREFRDLCTSLHKSKLVLTSRSADFQFDITNCSKNEIAALDDNQISNFAEKWLGTRKESQVFLDKIKASPFRDSTIKPINLAHLCVIYQRTKTIPKKSEEIYNLILDLMIKNWDFQRSISRESVFNLNDFEQKKKFLANLAYVLTTKFNSTRFSEVNLQDAFDEFKKKFRLESNDCLSVINELEGHTGIFIKCGIGKYEFCHKSIQEFLTAIHISRKSKFSSDPKVISCIPDELAITISISSDSSEAFCDFILNKFPNEKLPNTFYKKFINRLIIENPDFCLSAELIVSINLLIQNLSKITESINFLPEVKSENYKEDINQLIRLLDYPYNNIVLANFYENTGLTESKNILKLKRTKSHDEYNFPEYLDFHLM